jgi:hypothetical protein
MSLRRTPSKVGSLKPSGVLEVRISGRYKQLIDGEIDIETLDDEELARCQLKDKNGRFTGKPPTFLPRSLVLRMQREFFKRGDDLFAKSYVEAVKTMTRTMTDPMVDPAVQIKAAQYVIERVRGKTPDHVVVTGDDAPWQRILSRIIVGPDEISDIVDAEIVE